MGTDDNAASRAAKLVSMVAISDGESFGFPMGSLRSQKIETP
jgi:hypothetical protein